MNAGLPESPFSSGWHSAARRIPSPNQDERAVTAEVDMIVVHAISLPPGEFGSGCIDALFTNALDTAEDPRLAGLGSLRVSAHFLIDRGGALTQYVPLQARAWHAGVSSFGGQEGCNHRSIGVELEGTDETPFTDAQYAVLRTLCVALIQAYPRITHARIVGHSDIAPGRKTDPGVCFDWVRLRAAILAQQLSSAPGT